MMNGICAWNELRDELHFFLKNFVLCVFAVCCFCKIRAQRGVWLVGKIFSTVDGQTTFSIDFWLLNNRHDDWWMMRQPPTFKLIRTLLTRILGNCCHFHVENKKKQPLFYESKYVRVRLSKISWTGNNALFSSKISKFVTTRTPRTCVQYKGNK